MLKSFSSFSGLKSVDLSHAVMPTHQASPDTKTTSVFSLKSKITDGVRLKQPNSRLLPSLFAKNRKMVFTQSSNDNRGLGVFDESTSVFLNSRKGTMDDNEIVYFILLLALIFLFATMLSAGESGKSSSSSRDCYGICGGGI